MFSNTTMIYTYILSMYFKLHGETSTFMFWASISNMKLDEFSWLWSEEYLTMLSPILLKWWKYWIWFIEDVYKFHMFEIIVLWSWYIVSYKYIWIFKYMVLAPFDLVHEIILSIEIWELRATSSWREPPLEFQFWDIRLRYGSCVLYLCGGS